MIELATPACLQALFAHQSAGTKSANGKALNLYNGADLPRSIVATAGSESSQHGGRQGACRWVLATMLSRIDPGTADA